MSEQEMTAEKLIKRHLIQLAAQEGEITGWHKRLTAETIDEAWQKLMIESGLNHDYLEEFRGSGERTGLDCPDSRHYESETVGAQLLDGTWVGWTYWSGGGKFGNPEDIPWIEDAYLLDVEEQQKMVTVRKFKKRK